MVIDYIQILILVISSISFVNCFIVFLTWNIVKSETNYSDEKISILIPPMFLNSWLCLSKESLYQYKYSFRGKYNDVKNQISVKWNDPRINFKWPLKNLILSKRDK